MNWHIGQRIVAVKDHVTQFNKEDKFVVEGIKRCKCGCGDIVLDIGLLSRTHIQYCVNTNRGYYSDYEWFFRQSYFAPLDDLSNHTADSLMEEMDREVRVGNKELSQLK